MWYVHQSCLINITISILYLYNVLTNRSEGSSAILLRNATAQLFTNIRLYNIKKQNTKCTVQQRDETAVSTTFAMY
jgi:hypothetical protein